MNRSLQEESEKLSRSWMQHEAGWLRDYLVAGVEDPRINLQSILSRHFLVRAICGERFAALMAEEYKFSAAMNRVLRLVETQGGAEDLEAVLFALRRGADNAEGIEVPNWLVQIFSSLPMETDGVRVPNYIERFLSMNAAAAGQRQPSPEVLNTFCQCWAQVLAQEPAPAPDAAPRVLEPACGSANDYRFLRECGIAWLIDYNGFDLCDKNIENARALFPAIRFETSNVFEIASPGKSFDYCIVHDLFEHLSLEGLGVAVKEVCRVTRHGICAGFFQMDEIPEHVQRPVDDYHWNLLSMERMKEAFARHGFAAQALHIGSFLRQTTGCDQMHNPDAYTFILHAAPLSMAPTAT